MAGVLLAGCSQARSQVCCAGRTMSWEDEIARGVTSAHGRPAGAKVASSATVLPTGPAQAPLTLKPRRRALAWRLRMCPRHAGWAQPTARLRPWTQLGHSPVISSGSSGALGPPMSPTRRPGGRATRASSNGPGVVTAAGMSGEPGARPLVNRATARSTGRAISIGKGIVLGSASPGVPRAATAKWTRRCLAILIIRSRPGGRRPQRR